MLENAKISISDSSFPYKKWINVESDEKKINIYLLLSDEEKDISKEDALQAAKNHLESCKLVNVADCSTDLQTLAYELMRSSDDMLFIENDDEWDKDRIERVLNEIYEKFEDTSGIYHAIEASGDDAIMTLFSEFQSYFNYYS